MLTRKHFQMVADVLVDVAPYIPATRYAEVCGRFADALQRTNPRFQRSRFMSACGVSR